MADRRTGQRDLAGALGDQVRHALERLLDGLAAASGHQLDFATALAEGTAGQGGERLPEREQWRALYLAATRMVMRLTVIFFAEARGLLPCDNPVYQEQYSLERLFERLEQAPSAERETADSAWTIVLALFRLIHNGRDQAELKMTAHGGELFAPGSMGSPDPVRRALAMLEAPECRRKDHEVYEILGLLKYAKVPDSREPGSCPRVDYRLLRTEYLGMIYQGLLDYELRRAGPEQSAPPDVAGEPSGFCLVRWSGTRKGSGTFYTPQEITAGLVRHTLEPFCYRRLDNGSLQVRRPEDILALKILDPAMGSGSFLVAALDYLSAALARSMGGSSRSGGLRRQVAENCLYGVDLNPLAVELARISLWLEVMDPSLPFDFLAERLKVGNSLVGAWGAQVGCYPVKAWERDGGDQNHIGVHFEQGAITRRIKHIYQEYIKPHMQAGADGVHRASEALQPEAPQPEALQPSPARLPVRNLMDRWCAVWFWPVHRDEIPVLTPAEFWSPSRAVQEAISHLAQSHAFFHWEIEFPDLFTSERTGFDAVLGNPPWEVMKPDSREFFSNRDPLYRTYGKQEALEQQRRLFAEDREFEREWLEHRADFRAMSNWVSHAATACEESGAAFPFRHQGPADLNSYKLFLELAHHLLREGGRLGFLVPAGIYTDEGSRELRVLFLDQSRWEWLYGFHNRQKIFGIHASTKFAALIVQKGGMTASVRTAFLCEDPAALEQHDTGEMTVSGEQLRRFSPLSRIFLEIRRESDLALLERLYASNPALAESDRCPWPVAYTREFDMTNDSSLFSPLHHWEERGYRPDGLGRWVTPDGQVALPLYEGRMIGQFDFCSKGWVSGKGRQAIWRELPWPAKSVEPQYLMAWERYRQVAGTGHMHRVAMVNVSSATNTRTMIAAYAAPWPCGNAVPVLTMADVGLERHLAFCAVLNSFVYDYLIRHRMGGTNLNYFFLQETPLPPLPSDGLMAFIALHVAALNLAHPVFAPQWLELAQAHPELCVGSWRSYWATEPETRKWHRSVLDAAVAHLYGLSYADLAFILRPDETDPVGFWRVEKHLPVEERHTTLALQAFRRLEGEGIREFCAGGWNPPHDGAGAGAAEGWAEASALARRLSGEC